MKNTVSAGAGRRTGSTMKFPLKTKKPHRSGKQIRKILTISQILEGSGYICICCLCSDPFSTLERGVLGSGRSLRDFWVFRV